MYYSWISTNAGRTWDYNGANPSIDARIKTTLTVGHYSIQFYVKATQYRVFWNGLLLKPGADYSLSGFTLTFTLTPSVDDTIQIDLIVGNDNMYLQDIATYSAGAWHLSQSPTGNVDLWWNGVLLRYNSDFTLSGTTITFLTVVPSSTDFVAAAYSY